MEQTMTEQEYTDILDYLLTKLREVQSTDIVTEINQQINRGKTITKDSSDLKVKKIKQSEVGKTQTLPLSSEEAFETAIDYLSKIIVDVPSYSKSISERFGKNVNWEYDQSQSIKSLNTSEKFSLDTFTFNNSELEKAKSELQKMKNYIKE